MIKTKTFWNPETGISTCILQDAKKPELIFTGEAACHFEDRDMMNEKTGLTIAELRAHIKLFIHLRDNVIKPKMEALHRLYYSINQKANFDENNYYVCMIKRQYDDYKDNYKKVNEKVKATKQELKEYLAGKAKFYNQIREIRKDKNK